jgi:murein DD-endopeptidase MepM/ murein hydrolase activator NlpD
VVPEIMSQVPDLEDRGSLIENYVQINSELRKANRERQRELARGSRQEFLWREPFPQFAGGQVMSAFADRRTYVYEGEAVDQQTHLGFDLATTQQDRVPASNRGVVVLAEYFGIYGNAVVVDHGYGLMTLYAHLSSIDVEEGQEVERGESLGRTGATGLAGGDHLHFTTMIGGMEVNPVEWWDPKWIADRVKPKLGDALPYEP